MYDYYICSFGAAGLLSKIRHSFRCFKRTCRFFSRNRSGICIKLQSPAFFCVVTKAWFPTKFPGHQNYLKPFSEQAQLFTLFLIRICKMLAWLGRPSTNRIYTIPSPAHSYQTDSNTTILWSRICGFIPYIHLVSGGVEYERWMEFIVLRAGKVVVAQMLHRLQRKRHILLAKLENMVHTQHWRVKARTGDVLRCTPQLAWAMLFSNVRAALKALGMTWAPLPKTVHAGFAWKSIVESSSHAQDHGNVTEPAVRLILRCCGSKLYTMLWSKRTACLACPALQHPHKTW